MPSYSILDSRCVLVVGATSGIGRALARSIRALPSSPRVVAAGRRQDRLAELAAEGLDTMQVNVDSDRNDLKQWVDTVIDKHPDLDAVVFSAGIQREVQFSQPGNVDLDSVAMELNTNDMSIVTMITFFLPHFLALSVSRTLSPFSETGVVLYVDRKSKGHATFIVPITSELGVIPLPSVPTYSATKAALHSLSISLHAQLKDTNVHVMEILPPLVESELHDYDGTTETLSKIWMPLDVFTKKAMDGLQQGDVQIAIGLDDVTQHQEQRRLDAALKKLHARK